MVRTGVEKKVCKVLVGKPEGKNHSEDRGVDGRMLSKWILGRLAEGLEWIQLASQSLVRYSVSYLLASDACPLVEYFRTFLVLR